MTSATEPLTPKHHGNVFPDQNVGELRQRFPAEFTNVDGIYLPLKGVGRDFQYTDGDAAEGHIHQAILSARDRSSSSFELEQYITDWPSEYHLSRFRPNLLRPFPIHNCKKVLEIGAGCGAITRYLGETCTHVTALEGSRRRAAIVRDRCAGLDNVTCVAANLADVRFDSPFDLVVAIGVLEYAGKYSGPCDDPYAHFLKLAARVLSPNGLLVLAIENQLGLKYFGGDPEDHTGRRYEGIEGYYPGTNVRTFGRQLLMRYLAEAGLQASIFLPFPDYKLPRLIINAASANGGLRLSQWYDRQTGHGPFGDALVLPVIERNGLLADLANSFLLVASKDGTVPSYPWDAVYYSLNRKRYYQTETRLQKKDAVYVVSKSRLFSLPEKNEKDVLLKQTLDRSLYVAGEKLSLAMLRALRHDSADCRKGFDDLMAAWNSLLLGRAMARTSHHDTALPANCVDCTPFNLVMTETGLREFDQEWVLERNEVTIGWVLFRGLYWFLCSYWPYLTCSCVHPGEWGHFIRQQFHKLGYTLARSELLALAEQEARFMEATLPAVDANEVARTMISNLGPASRALGKALAAAQRGWQYSQRLASAVWRRGRRLFPVCKGFARR